MHVQLKAYAGTKINAKNITSLVLDLGNRVKIEHEFLIISGEPISQKLLVGNDFLKKNNVTLRHGK